VKTLSPSFVEFMPDVLEDGVLYISPRFALVSHKCCCGCGEEVVLKLSPTDWHMIYDGETVSLRPSIGNWGLKCQSHYWITKNQVQWAPKWSDKEIQANRQLDQLRKESG
jgi:hypothetical protein